MKRVIKTLWKRESRDTFDETANAEKVDNKRRNDRSACLVNKQKVGWRGASN